MNRPVPEERRAIVYWAKEAGNYIIFIFREYRGGVPCIENSEFIPKRLKSAPSRGRTLLVKLIGVRISIIIEGEEPMKVLRILVSRLRSPLSSYVALTLIVCSVWNPSPVTATDGGRDLSLTVYNNNLAVVRDVRALSVTRGEDWLRFTDVPARIDPTTVHLKPITGGEIEVLEQNFVYDLVNPEKVMDRYIDHQIRVTVEDGRLFEGTLLSHSGGRLVLDGAGDNGGLIILSADKIADYEFPALPQGLITRPTLEWLLKAERDGERELEVSYMTSGLSWHAEYVAVVGQDDKLADLAGWVSVDNRSGARYENAELQLVAGEPHIVSPPAAMRRGSEKMMMAANSVDQSFVEETFFEYHLYTLGRTTTLKENEVKQLSLFSPATCEVTKLYETNPQRDNGKVRVMIEAVNSTTVGLGMPLPKGKVRVYKRDQRERLQFVGEDYIDHTPRDEKVRMLLGKAFDLVAERTELDSRSLGRRSREVDIKIELRNRKEKEDVVIVVQEDLHGDWEIRAQSISHKQINSRRIEFEMPVKAGETKTITYTVRYSW